MASSFIEGLLGVAGKVINKWGWANRKLSKLVINRLVKSTRNRPHPWSTASDYTSWKSLTDRTYQGRHLPAADQSGLPATAKVKELFERPPGKQRLSDKSTCLFPAFAQYLTDGFIRTANGDRKKTTSNHEIDLCQLYGLNEKQTDALRLRDQTKGKRGRLKSQKIGTEEFPPYLYLRDGSAVDPQFAVLDPPLGVDGPPAPISLERKLTMFAVGGDRVNSTPFTSMMNTLLLREHNRIADELGARNPDWDDEQVFQTARNIMIPIFIKIVVEQYINHITPAPFKLIADPSVAWEANWNRPNWITAEFSLLYRWHALMPDAIDLPTGPIPLMGFGLDNSPLIEVGLAKAFLSAAGQPAGELGAFNTGAALMIVEEFAIDQARSNKLASYNAYRVQFGKPPARKFSDISSDPAVVAKLAQIYQSADQVEFYAGLFAENRVPKSPLPELLLTMVGVDAFSQALTNPLLSEHVFNAATFTDWGFELIKQTSSLGDLLKRQGAITDPGAIAMTQPSWSFS
jgi:Animal haem peroxidase